ncbi:MAG: hypothetical protein NTY90_02385 [Candidatus Micrarchaeota archaeon]|nr:hypothetical protein [Candidatus Micrarchaeota archaeon]
MELLFQRGKILFNRELSRLDEFVLKFTSVLDRAGIRYAVVSGYVAIVFGRSRGTEDVDVLVERLGKEKFAEFWRFVEKNFDCINAASENDAFENYLSNDTALRFASRGAFIPNIEFKSAKNELDYNALKHRIELVLNGKSIFISPLEQQICYKLYLGSEKDVEDARFLYKLFKERLDVRGIKMLARALKVGNKLALLG